jgi:hypothetical protein
MVTAITAIIAIITKGCIEGFFLIRLLTMFLDLMSNFEGLDILFITLSTLDQHFIEFHIIYRN